MINTENNDKKNSFLHVRRVVIKIGTSLLTRADHQEGINYEMIGKLRDEIVFLRNKNIKTLLVTSGSVNMGREYLEKLKSYSLLAEPPIVRKQALAAVGQSRLMSAYADSFRKENIPVAQILITAREFRDRRSYLNIGNTIEELISLDILPVVNENDTVSTEELHYGDNDILSAACASLFRADMLIILTAVPGFMVNGKRIRELSDIGDEEYAHAGGAIGPGVGGMQTKLRAGQLCLRGGEIMAILPGAEREPIRSLFNGEDIGTIIKGKQQKKLSARKRWLLYVQVNGAVRVDPGAKRALIKQGSSLLPVGISRIVGRFLAGDVIDIEDEYGRTMGRGISNYSYREIGPLLGLNGEEIRRRGHVLRAAEVIHRNNLILESG